MNKLNQERQSFYSNIPNFWHDLYGEEYALYDIKIEQKEKINQIREAANEIGRIFLKTAKLLRTLDDNTFLQLGFPERTIPYLKKYTYEHETVISRLDFALYNGEIKLMELNADTPTFIKECFHVNGKVCEQFNVKDPNRNEEHRLIQALNDAIKSTGIDKPKIVFTSHEDHDEDRLTSMYLKELLPFESDYVSLSQLKVKLTVDDLAGVYTPNQEKIDILYRQTYPIEHLIDDVDPITDERIGEYFLTLMDQDMVKIFNPISAFLLQSKAVQALIWGLHESSHPFYSEQEHNMIDKYFLPTFIDREPFIDRGLDFVKKPAFGREGDTIEIYDKNGNKTGEDANKTYESSLAVYQQFVPLPDWQINTELGKKNVKIMYGCFLLNGEASAIGIRAGGQITDNTSYFLPIGEE